MDEDSIDLRSIFGLLRRRFWIIVGTVALALAVAGASLLVLKPVYSATALVLVDPTKKNLLDPEAQLSGSGSDSLRVDSEVELVKSETTLLRVANALDLADDAEFGLQLGIRDTLLAFLRIAEPQLPTGDEAQAAVLGKLDDAVSARRRGLTFLIAISAQSGRPELAAAIANAVAENYIKEQLQAKVASTLQSRDIIQSRIADASATLAASENAFDDFVDKNLQRISDSTGRTDLQQMRGEILRLSAVRAQDAALADRASTSLANEDWASLASTLKDEALANIQRQRTALLQRLSGTDSSSPAAIDLRNELESLTAQIRERGAASLDSLRASVASAQTKATELRDQLRNSVIQSNLPPDIVTSIYELQQSSEIARTQYQTLLTRQKELDTQAFLQVADSRIVSQATPPVTPSFPNPRLILILAGLAGLGVGVALAFLIENFLGGFTSEAQAEAILKQPVVSLVPRQRIPKRTDGPGLTVADTLITAPLSIYSEAIRRIRIGVDQAIQRSHVSAGKSTVGRVIMTSSAAPGEGKTTLALSLGRAYALSGMTTLIIDADLRKPSLHKHLGVEASDGLLDYLAGADGEIGSIMTVDDASGAQIVLGSRRSDVPTDQLVASKTFGKLIAAARNNFDVVVVDTPPIGPVVDGLYLSSFVDAVVFVAKWSETPQQDVRSAVAALEQAKPDATPIVIVLNQQAKPSASYRGKYSGYFSYG